MDQVNRKIDNDSVSNRDAPALDRDVNLSRRACWLNIRTSEGQHKSSNNAECYWSTHLFLFNIQGSMVLPRRKIRFENQTLKDENVETVSKKSECDLFKIVHNSQLLQTCSCLNIWEKASSHYGIIKREKYKGSLDNFDAVRIFSILFGCLLLCANVTTARPNHSASVEYKKEIELPERSSHDLTTDLLEIYPDLDYSASHNKRAAELVQTSTSNTHEAIESEHHVQRYPVAQVEFQRVKTPFIIGLWILSASIAKIGFHMTSKLHRIFPESCLLIVVGGIIGVVLYLATEVQVSPLTPNTFFFYMLPPIILDAGYFMPNRLFFDNLGTILLMAVVGTIFNIATIGASLWACGLTGMFTVEIPLLDSFLFSSLISAVDPVAVLAVFEEIHVDEVLYIVVFGESLLNDAVTVVLYHMMESYNGIGIKNINVTDLASGVASFFVVAIGGTIIGVIWGFLTGIVTRFTDHVRVIEPIFIFVMAYLAYLNAEIFHMSGILAITFCGITMKNYVESNISQKSHTTVKYALKMLSSSSETIIFMFLGVATINNRHVWNTWFVLLTIFFCSTFRVIGVIILSALANRFRLHKLSKVDQFVMSYGGLRGAVAFALALLVDETHVPLQPMFVTTTIAVIYFTVFVQGITIKPLVKLLNVKRASKRKPTMNERIHERFMDHLMAGIEDIIGKTGNYNMRDKFKRFDNRFIRPFLLRDAKGAEPKIIETYSKLTMKDAMEVLRRNPSTIGQMSGTESMSALFRNYTTNYLGGSPSFSNLETCSRNLDMHELDYNPSKKDLTDARIHHLLAEELKPYRRHRRLSYSRHAVDDRDLSTQVNYKMHMNIRRMVNDRKHHKRSKRNSNKEGLKQNHVSFNDFQGKESPKHQTNGTDDWDEDGLTFTAKSTLDETSMIAEEERTPQSDPDCDLQRVATPTAIESQLPWKRSEGENENCEAVKQNEFPAWASNKEYLAYNSPSATFLGLFRRESCGSGGGPMTYYANTSETSGSETPSSGFMSTPIALTRQQTVLDLAARRHNRKGSQLEISGGIIPEKTLRSTIEEEEWISRSIDNKDSDSDTENEKDLTNEKFKQLVREPLLPKQAAVTTPKMSNRQINQNPLVVALLSPVNSLVDIDDDEEIDEEEDINLYDDDHIVNTTFVNNPKQNDFGSSPA